MSRNLDRSSSAGTLFSKLPAAGSIGSEATSDDILSKPTPSLLGGLLSLSPSERFLCNRISFQLVPRERALALGLCVSSYASLVVIDEGEGA